MKTYGRSHLSDRTLLHAYAAHLADERTAMAEGLADLAEIDARRLYLPAGYPSLFAFCVGERGLSEDAAAKRIQVARVARRFPALFAALADGRLHLSGVVLLAPHLAEENMEQLLAAAAHRTKAQIEQLLAGRFPRPDLLAWVATPPSPSGGEHAPGHVGATGEHAPGHVEAHGAPASVEPRSRVEPLAPQRFAVQFTMDREGHDLLRRAQELLGHEIPAGDIAAVVERALLTLVGQLEKRKFAATANPRPSHGCASRDSRHIPAHVRRAVWERDQGRCTFVGESGHRCEARAGLQFDHVEPFARGGEATVSGIRLLCRAHNQFEAERTFGTEFMRHKRMAAAEARAAARAREASEATAAAGRAAAAERAREKDVVPWLRALGFNAAEARNAATRCHDMQEDASLEERVRLALSGFRVRGSRVERAVQRLETGGALAAATPGAGQS